MRRTNSRTGHIGVLACILLTVGLLATPAQAQFFSGSYELLKAVRESDGPTASRLLLTATSAQIDRADPDSGEAPVHIVVKRKDVPWLNLLLGKGASTNLADREGNTPLILASGIGFTDGVRLLLAHGGDVNRSNRSGETPVIKAVQARDERMVRLLLENGADPKLSDSVAGYNALDYAQQDRRSAGILRLLESAGKPAAPATAGAPTPAAPKPAEQK